MITTNGATAGSRAAPLDVLGVGFGPSNLALAICLRELAPTSTCLFLERNARFEWHPGMLIDGARMQISFLKDLVSLRDLNSPYTFLQYVKARGRLERFVNLQEFRPTRIEFQDYLNWVASDFAEQVRYGATVTDVTAVADPQDGDALTLFRVEAREATSDRPLVLWARNVVYAAGGAPRRPAAVSELSSDRVIHSSDLLKHFPEAYDRERSWEFTVVGAGQSAAEVVVYLLEHYEYARVHLLISGYALRPTDNSSFVNEQFTSWSAGEFFALDEPQRAALIAELRSANYGVVREDLLERLYHMDYLDEVKGRRRLIVHPHSRLATVTDNGHGVCATVESRTGVPTEVLRCDGLVIATGYDRALDASIFSKLLPLIETGPSRHVKVTRHHRVRMAETVQAGLYVQGYAESHFGLGDTLLSLLPFRAQDIVQDICARTERSEVSGPHAAQASRQASTYPPRRHVETDPEKLFAIVERYSFATVISASGTDEPVVTQIPLVLDRTRGARGALFGHVDRANPHAELLQDRPVLAIFHGPNAFISPSVYETDQLPTWNSISVHVRGQARVLDDRASVVRGLCGIAQCSGALPQLRPDDPRIDRLIGLIVGFEVEIDELVGRFKLSQDRTECDRHRAAHALARKSEHGERELIEYAVGLPLGADTDRRRNGSPLNAIGDAA